MWPICKSSCDRDKTTGVEHKNMDEVLKKTKWIIETRPKKTYDLPAETSLKTEHSQAGWVGNALIHIWAGHTDNGHSELVYAAHQWQHQFEILIELNLCRLPAHTQTWVSESDRLCRSG